MKQNFLKLCHCRRIPIEENKILLKSASKSLVLTADNVQKVLESLIPNLNGTCTRNEIISNLPLELKEAADELLQIMEAHQFLKEDNKEIESKLAQCHIMLIGFNHLGDKILENIEDSGIKNITVMGNNKEPFPDTEQEMIRHLRHIDMAVVCTDTPRPDICNLVNKASLELGLPWLLVQTDGRDGWVGPLFLPKETGCYTCLMYRIFSNSFYPDIDKSVYAHLTKHLSENTNNLLTKQDLGMSGNADLEVSFPPFYSMIAGMASLEIIRHITGISPPLTYQAQIITDSITGISKREILHRIPRCPDCSQIAEKMSGIQPFSG